MHESCGIKYGQHNFHFFHGSNAGSSFLKRLQRSTAKLGGQRSGKSLSSADILAVCRVCEMYQMTLATLTELRRDILTGKGHSYPLFNVCFMALNFSNS